MWTSANMLGIHRTVMLHKFSIFKEARPIIQKKHKLGEERRKITKVEVKKLRETSFIKEVKYTTWLVLMNKSSNQWRMWTNFTDKNKACPKDAYPFLSIDKLVDEDLATKFWTS